MGTLRVGPRLNLAKQMARVPGNRGRELNTAIFTPGGHILRANEAIGLSAQGISELAAKVDTMRGIAEVSLVSAAPGILIPEMVKIPAGRFTMGSTAYSDEQPIRNVTISEDFELGKYEVTNTEWKSFCEATSREIPDLVADPSKARHPVVNVSWHDAAAYTKWLSAATKENYRLPTEAEGEYASRGADGRNYPWGNEWDSSKVTFNTNGTQPVDAHPEGASPFGVMDLSGNVWEWRADWYAGKYDPEALVDPIGPESGSSRVLRGGSWSNSFSGRWRSAYRYDGSPEGRRSDVGFRVAKDLK